MNFDNIIFYCGYGNGDLWISREFVKEIASLSLADSYYYAHNKDHHLFFDLPYLKFKELDYNCLERQPYALYGKDLYINTWLGYAYGKYVFPGVTCSLSNLRRMFTDTLSSLGIDYRFSTNDINYVPELDITLLEDEYYENINQFVYRNIDRPLILISNGSVQSGQASNFSFDSYVNDEADKYKDVLFLVTENYSNKPTNVICIKDIIKKQYGTDLPEISYLSTFVDTIAGRSSGPYVYSQNRQNYNNPDLYMLGYTWEKACAHMLTQQTSRATLAWCGTDNPNDIKMELEKAVKWSNKQC
jgi:hypothetical protein